MADENFYREPVAALSQGDILMAPHLLVSGIEYLAGDGESVEFTATGRPTLGVVMNYDCEIEKPWSETLVICPIVPLSKLLSSQQANAKRNRIAHLFFMPRHKDILADSVAILNQQTTIDRTMIDLSKRVATLDTGGRFALYAQFVRWISRWELTELTCPRCGVEFAAKDILPVRDPTEP